MSNDLERQPVLQDFFDNGFENKFGALYKEGFDGCIQFWDGRFFHSNEISFLAEIKTIDILNNILIENTIS